MPRYAVETHEYVPAQLWWWRWCIGHVCIFCTGCRVLGCCRGCYFGIALALLAAGGVDVGFPVVAEGLEQAGWVSLSGC